MNAFGYDSGSQGFGSDRTQHFKRFASKAGTLVTEDLRP